MLGRATLLTSVALAAVVIAAPSASMASGKLVQGSWNVATNSQTYTDPTGDSGAGPDIATSVVSNDDAGILTFVISVPNRPSLVGDDALIVSLTTDTLSGCVAGGTGGYSFIFNAGSSPGVVLCRVQGNQFVISIARLASLVGSYSNGQATFSVNRSDLGVTNELSFDVSALARVVVDRAPDTPRYGYRYQIVIAPPSPPTLTAGKVQLTPARAGKRFTASMVVKDAGTGEPVQGRVTCLGNLAGKALKPSHGASSASGKASCTWLLPKHARGKRFGGSITESFRGSKVSRRFSTSVR